MDILLVGPGTSHHRIHGGAYFGSIPGENIHVVDYDNTVLRHWNESGATTYWMDLRNPYSHVLPVDFFDEVHAYEVLNLLPGTAADFFALWKTLHRCMKLGGSLYATVPHWQSEWIHAYPGPQRVYTAALLGYLDHDAQLGAKEDFDRLWPDSFNFNLVEQWHTMRAGAQTPDGFHFCLKKGRR